jgi:hypothetical protein
VIPAVAVMSAVIVACFLTWFTRFLLSLLGL